jgi:hypothetical protein
MNIRRVLTALTGVVQEVVGVLSAVLAILLYFNVLEVQNFFNLPPELLLIYLLILGLFSIFSILSGLSLILEGRK